MSHDPFRTFHANQALELSELFNLRFARLRFGSADPRIVVMREPDGPSTDSGRKARQPLVLVRDVEDESGVVFGFVDLFKRSADVKGYPVLKHQYVQRFGTALVLTRPEYARLVDEVKDCLNGHAIDVRLLNTPRGASTTVPKKPVSAAPRSAQPTPTALPATVAVLPMILSAAVGFVICYLFITFGWLTPL